MRSDQDLGLKQQDGELLHLTGERVQGSPSTSLSGHESNHLFMSSAGKQFTEMSDFSGLDHKGDSRAFAVFDYNRDGWPDIAMVNANAPRFQIFENRMSAHRPSDQARFIALRLVGGNRTAASGSGFSSLDPVGARVDVSLGDLSLTRELTAGRGLAARNSSTLLIGIGTHANAEAVMIRWPSGRTSDLGSLAAGQLVTVYEDESQAPNGKGMVSEPYLIKLSEPMPVASAKTPAARFQPELVSAKGTSPRLRAYTAMATWCASCKRELPQGKRLTEAFAENEVEFYGIGIDTAESPDQLREYIEKWQPGYELLASLDNQTRDDFRNYLMQTLQSDALPCTVITSSDGRILKTVFDIPTVSDFRKMLDSLAEN